MNEAEPLERCDREIAAAIAASHVDRPLTEHLGILIWELDWRVERELLIENDGGKKDRR